MKIKLLIVSVFMLLLTSCAMPTKAKYEDILNSWIGASEQSLIETWGVPDGTYELNNLKFLTYNHSSQRVIYGAPPVYINNWSGDWLYSRPIGGTPNMIVQDWCKTTFTIEKQKIIKWSISGNSCVAN